MTFERRPLAGNDGHVLVSTPLEQEGFLAAFTERTGGVSDEPYDSLNLSFQMGDEAEAVRTNRRLVADALGVASLVTATQIHGADVLEIEADDVRGDEPIGEADAMWTRAPGVPLAVLTADCVPVVLASPSQGRVAIVHAGWRGLAAGIISNVVSLFRRPKDVIAAIGPAIGVDHYQVGDEVFSALHEGMEFGPFGEDGDGRGYLDLTTTIDEELSILGVGVADVAGVCTSCEPERFYSFRRDGVTGRQAGIAMRIEP